MTCLETRSPLVETMGPRRRGGRRSSGSELPLPVVELGELEEAAWAKPTALG